MEKKTIIAIALSVIIFASWPYLIKFVYPEAYKKLYAKQTKVVETVTPQVQDEKNIQSTKEIAEPSAVQAVEAVEALEVTENENLVPLSNKDLKIFFSTKGGVVKGIELLSYKDKAGNYEKLTSNKILQMPLFEIEEKNLPQLSQRNFKIVSQTEESISFQTTLPNNIVLTKTYSLKDKYLLELNISLENKSSNDFSFFEGYKLNLLPGVRVYNKEDNTFYGVATLKAEDASLETYNKTKRNVIYDNVYWVSQYNKYFCFILKSKSPLSNVYMEPLIDEPQLQLSIRKKGFVLEKNAKIIDNYEAYVGPKDIQILKSYNNHLDKIINFGFFDFIGKIILWLLNFFNGYIKNYGIAIILVTIVVKILMHPLTQKSFKSMQEMQKVQPRLQALKEQYKNDPQKFQKETMLLYKTHKINPMGGCLPLILQMPIFFALFSVLQNAIELRQAPLGLWIHDLSLKDPTYILPIVMGATMIIQQKMTPSMSMDPMQAKLMLFMPIIFTFFFLNFPSGLVLYWLINNILTIGHQLILKQKSK